MGDPATEFMQESRGGDARHARMPDPGRRIDYGFFGEVGDICGQDGSGSVFVCCWVEQLGGELEEGMGAEMNHGIEPSAPALQRVRRGLSSRENAFGPLIRWKVKGGIEMVLLDSAEVPGFVDYGSEGFLGGAEVDDVEMKAGHLLAAERACEFKKPTMALAALHEEAGAADSSEVASAGVHG